MSLPGYDSWKLRSPDDDCYYRLPYSEEPRECVCEDCRGSGVEDGSPLTCVPCNGTGRFNEDRGYQLLEEWDLDEPEGFVPVEVF